MRFVWDEKKNQANIKKHGLNFANATSAFFDPMRKEYYDDKHSSLNEDRFLLAGIAKNAVLFIIYTEPEPETFRIISARRAKNYEAEVYYYGNG